MITLPETKSSHLKMDGWKTIVSFWYGFLAGAMLVSERVIDATVNLEVTILKNFHYFGVSSQIFQSLVAVRKGMIFFL